ncbi:tRNA (pseudouridine(54)-N(1))-methyltransferase [uncultured archaeon]|nr:tRNA (pseudouridine(54)-N(1))-methyltransferase [uncultured archaeon]
MREFVYFSGSAVTSGKALSDGNLMHAGRMDIAIHSFIQGVFLSHGFRKDAKFHFVFYGMPDPPKHIEIQVTDELEISKKDIGNLIKKILYKYRAGQKTEVLPGCFIEKKSFLKIIEDLVKEKKEIYILDKKGEDIRKAKIEDNCVFILGDHEGLPKKELKRLKEIATPVSIGDRMYFASQTVAVVNNELDYRGI